MANIYAIVYGNESEDIQEETKHVIADSISEAIEKFTHWRKEKFREWDNVIINHATLVFKDVLE